ncbi:MAG: MarR family winged helix-turn-helix transcriptional regulator [Frankiaceae bacterium]
MPTATAADAALASELRLSVMRLARRLRAQRVSTDLGLTHLATLSTLELHGRMTPGELAAHERVQPPSMTRVIAVLEERGLVAREPHPSDRRQVLVQLSSAGREMLKGDRRRRDAWLSQRLTGLDPDEVELLHKVAPILERLAQAE